MAAGSAAAWVPASPRAVIDAIARGVMARGVMGALMRVVTTMAVSATLAAAAPTAPDEPSDATAGEALYHTGRHHGQAIAAWQPGLGELPPAVAACANCHRPSGLGGSEGGVRVPPITAGQLFAPGQPPTGHQRLQGRQWLRHQSRSAYTVASLARALRDGIDPDGRALAPAMPRYQLDDQAVADLLAYLGTRQRDARTGLDAAGLHLATVFTPDAPPARRAAVEAAMAAWSASAAWGPVKVRWQAWTLTGLATDWPAQLSARMRATPVYALLSGAGGADWSPVAAWCEAQRLPCLFPSIDRVPTASGDTEADRPYWNMYLDAGLDGEARLLAQHLARWPAAQRAGVRIRQLAEGPAGAAAAAALCAAALPWVATDDCGLPPTARGGDGPANAPGTAPQAQAAELVVLWLGPAAIRDWLSRQPPPGQAPGTPLLVLSARLAPPAATLMPAAWRPHVRWLSQRSDPVRQAAGAALSLIHWRQRLGLPDDLDPATVAEVHAATFFFGDALAQTQGAWAPEHLLERLEVAVDQRPAGALFFRLSLGPGQRIAAQGGQVLAFEPPRHMWLVPLPGHLRAVD